ncbi:MAG: DUF2341 domain-containing protein [bacterium]
MSLLTHIKRTILYLYKIRQVQLNVRHRYVLIAFILSVVITAVSFFSPSVYAGGPSNGVVDQIHFAIFRNNDGSIGTQVGSDDQDPTVEPNDRIFVCIQGAWTTKSKDCGWTVRWKLGEGAWQDTEAIGTGSSAAWEFWNSDYSTLDEIYNHFSSVEYPVIESPADPGDLENENSELWFPLEAPATKGVYELVLYDSEYSEIAETISVDVDITVASLLTGVSNSLSSNTPSETAIHTIAFTTTFDLSSDGRIVVTFPSGFDISGVTNDDISSDTMDGDFSTDISGQVLTITRVGGGTDQTADDENIIIANITNTAIIDNDYTVTVETRDGNSDTLNDPTESEEFAVLPWSCDNDYFSYQRSIVIDHTKVGTNNSGTLPATGFPVLIDLSGDWLKTTIVDADNGRIESSSGHDIIFKQDNIILFHEIEEYDATSGHLVAWVRVDSLSKATDTTITMLYGNECSIATEYSEGVWDPNFVGVWHLIEPTDATCMDSTGYSNDGTPSGSPAATTAGKIAGALDFDGDDSYVSMSAGGITENHTIEGWVYPQNLETVIERYFQLVSMSIVRHNGVGGLGQAHFYIRTDDTFRHIKVDNEFTDDTWFHLAGIWDGTNQMLYINGELADSQQPGGALNDPSDGFISDPTETADAIIDEVRFSSKARDVDWIKTCYNNQSDTTIGEGYFIKSLGNEKTICTFFYRRAIAMDHTKVGMDNSGELPATGFPVLIDISGDWLKTTAEDPVNGCIEDADGDDIIFRASNGKTGLYHEIEDYDGSNGTLVAWVRVNSLSKETDTTIYMYYGNACITDPTEEPEEVWDDNFKGVWHLKEDPSTAGTGGIKDSTSNDHDGTDQGSMVSGDQIAGRIGDALQFDAVGKYIDFGDVDDFDFGTSNFSVSLWVKGGGDTDPFVTKNIYSGTYNGLYIYESESHDTFAYYYGDYVEYGENGDDGEWHHLAAVREGTGSNEFKIYLDGGFVVAGTVNTDMTNDCSFMIHRWYNDVAGSVDGTQIDEVRVSNTIRDADWIKTCYNNQMWPNKDATDDGFITVGDVEDNFCTFSYRNLITIDCDKVSADLYDFPFLFDVTDDHLRHIDYSGDVTHASGYDIIFRSSDTSVCDGYAPCDLYHEVEEYNATTGHLVAWVKIPFLSGDTSTDIYIYYGSECVTEPTESPENVWDENFKGVWHLAEDQSGTGAGGLYQDSTSNDNDGTDDVSATGQDGQIDGGQEFDASDDGIYCGTGDSLNITQQITVSAWVNIAARPAKDKWYTFVTRNNSSARIYTPYIYGLDASTTTLGSEFFIGGAKKDLWHGAIDIPPNEWAYVVVTFDGTYVKHYVNTVLDNDNTTNAPGTIDDSTGMDFVIGGKCYTESFGWFNGFLDEIRVSSIARSVSWMATEYNNQSSPSTFYSYDPNSYESDEYGRPTAVSLTYFRAKGQQDGTMMLSWETAQEIDNLGFYLYKARNPFGPFTRITDKMIPGLSFSVRGKKYTHYDAEVTPGTLYYYKLEDIEIGGKRTMHGPICVDWDGDGIPDDWEIAYGLNPMLNDSGLDPDGDGLTNLEEYERGTDSLNPDTDGDGICDGDEGLWIDHQEAPFSSKHVKQPVIIISSDDTGITLELHTEAFESEKIIAEDKNTYDRLRIRDYIHGFTSETGWPELPFKGVLLDLPEGVDAALEVIGTESTIHQDYWVYPLPEKVASTEGGIDEVTEIFTIDEAAYAADTLFPRDIARCGDTYIFRGQRKLHLLFYPLAFNPAARELTLLSRIMVRINFKEEERKGKAERAAVSRARASRMARAWTPPTSEAFYTLTLADKGIYRLDKGYLESKGVPVSEIDLRLLRLYNLGREVALYIYDQDGNNLLDFGDYIEFYGTLVHEEYVKYTNDNVYFLITEGGEGEPKRMAQLEAAPVGGAVPETFIDTVHYEQDEYYLLMLPGGDSLDRWVFSTAIQGEGIEWVDQNTPAPGSIVPFTLTLPGVAGKGSLTVCMWGLGENEHEVEIYCNGVYLSTVTWVGVESYQASLSGIDLVSGSNTVGLKCNGETDVIAVDWFKASYPRSFIADNDQLLFTLSAGSRGQVSGFSESDLLLYDITLPDEAKVALNFTVTGAAESYTLDFEPQYDAGESGEMTFYTLSQGAQKLPLSLSANTRENLTNTSNGADYLVITHRDIGWDLHGELYPWLSELAALRQSQGLRVKIIDVDIIYNEFAYGFPTPNAIKDFLEFAYESWSRPAPRYVLLLGDSTYDYKNNLNGLEQNFSYLPAYLSATRVMGEGPSDDWFVMLEGGDDIPDMHIGRLPAVNAEQAEVMVNKILAYEDALNSKSWEKNVLFIADNQNNDDEESFEIMSEDSSALVPPGLNAPFKAYLDNYYSASGLKGEIKAKINEGSLMVNYSGHGSTQVWGMESIFNNQDVPDLTNERMLPFFVSMTCLTGYFIYPESWSFPCMAEALLRAGEGGAISAFMSAAMTDPKGQHVLDTAVFDALFTEDVRTLGPAITLAKQTLLANQFGPEPEGGTFLLFGDPAMSLKVPIPRKPLNLKVEAEPGPEGGVMLSWDEALDCDGEPVFAYNLYRSTTPDGEYSLVSPYIPYWLLPYEENLGKSDTTYYYVLTSVDFDGDESVRSRSVSGRTGTIPRSEPKQANPWDTYIVTGTVTIVDGPSTSQDSSNLGKGCFISTLFSYDRSDKASIIN